MSLKPFDPPSCSLYLVTPPLCKRNANAFAEIFAKVLCAVPAASALVRLAPEAKGDAKAIISPPLRVAVVNDCAVLVGNDARLAATLGPDGVHIGGEELRGAVESQHPDRIVGAGALRTRDEAMTAGEAGVDYVMFGESWGPARAIPLEWLIERVDWWAKIFETPCVAFAASMEAAGPLARAGADFVALDEAIWSASSPVNAASEARCLLVEATVEIK